MVYNSINVLLNSVYKYLLMIFLSKSYQSVVFFACSVSV